MSELRVTGRSEDGSHLILTDHEEREYTLRISDNLRATINQPRLASVSNEVEPALSVKEIQARLRAGALIEDLAREANWPQDKVERFAGPILQERAYVLSVANSIPIRNQGAREQVTFIEVVQRRLATNGVAADSLTWNTHRRDDGLWVIRLSYPTVNNFGGGHGDAVWFFDMTKRTILAEDEGASWIMGEQSNSASNLASSSVKDSEPEKNNHGLVYTNPTVTINSAPTPRLSVIREHEDAEDGVKKRASVPSWDEIMFGTKKPDDSDN
mgnify:CR=1 FL=1